jgi:hypothetical protein
MFLQIKLSSLSIQVSWVQIFSSLLCQIPTVLPEWGTCIPPLKNVKGKVVPVLFLTEHNTMKAYWGSGGVAPCILDLSTRWR